MDFDAIVVGTGMGAGAAGYTLVRAGLKVLFLERGLPRSQWDSRLGGDYPEKFVTASNRTQVFERAGRATYKVNLWIPVLGGGEGGGTAVYGAELFRFHPDDLRNWPQFTYDDLVSYYRQCEEMLKPNGTQDPLSKDRRSLAGSREFSATGRELFNFYTSQQLHPYLTPVGFENTPDCQHCFGFFCAKDCKKTSSNVFIEPAVKTGRAHVEYSTKVEKISTEGQVISGVQCKTPSGLKEFRAKYYFLAAGALATPTLLLNSKSPLFPSGLGNENGLVGRFLMRHLIDFYYVKTESSHVAHGHLPEISISDFHQHNKRWGVLNSGPGLMPPEIMASEFVAQLKAQAKFPVPEFLLKPIVAFILQRWTKGKIIVCPIVEDSPSFENRVLPGSDLENITINYQISQEDKMRLRESRRHLLKLFKPLEGKLIKVAEDSGFLAHVCGTCRMHVDATKGVVDSNGKVFGTENLYISDSSIFPTSGGANPSLTVAACAMKIAKQFEAKVWTN